MSARGHKHRPFRKSGPEGPVDRTRLASISLHISAVLFSVMSVLLVLAPFSWDPASAGENTPHASVMWVLAALCIALAVLAHVLIRALRRRKRWAWNTAAVLFGLYLASAFLPLGVLGLFGLLSKGTRASFARARRRRAQRQRVD